MTRLFRASLKKQLSDPKKPGAVSETERSTEVPPDTLPPLSSPPAPVASEASGSEKGEAPVEPPPPPPPSAGDDEKDEKEKKPENVTQSVPSHRRLRMRRAILSHQRFPCLRNGAFSEVLGPHHRPILKESADVFAGLLWGSQNH